MRVGVGVCCRFVLCVGVVVLALSLFVVRWWLLVGCWCCVLFDVCVVAFVLWFVVVGGGDGGVDVVCCLSVASLLDLLACSLLAVDCCS